MCELASYGKLYIRRNLTSESGRESIRVESSFLCSGPVIESSVRSIGIVHEGTGQLENIFDIEVARCPV